MSKHQLTFSFSTDSVSLKRHVISNGTQHSKNIFVSTEFWTNVHFVTVALSKHAKAVLPKTSVDGFSFSTDNVLLARHEIFNRGIQCKMFVVMTSAFQRRYLPQHLSNFTHP